jgi:hypothetical protein
MTLAVAVPWVAVALTFPLPAAALQPPAVPEVRAGVLTGAVKLDS